MPYLVSVNYSNRHFKLYLNHEKGENFNAEIYKILDYILGVW